MSVSREEDKRGEKPAHRMASCIASKLVTIESNASLRIFHVSAYVRSSCRSRSMSAFSLSSDLGKSAHARSVDPYGDGIARRQTHSCPFCRSGRRAIVLAIPSYSIRRARSCCAEASFSPSAASFCRVSSLDCSAGVSYVNVLAQPVPGTSRTESSDLLPVRVDLPCRNLLYPLRLGQLLRQLV